MIQFLNVAKQYHQLTVLSNITFLMKPGEMVFLTGPSGAGKSTVLKLASQMEKPTRGHIQINQYHLSKLHKRHTPQLRRHLGIIHQNPQLIQNKTVFDNVALPLEIQGYHYPEMKRRVQAALDKVGLLSKEKCFPLSLSCGEQQRVGIARAIVHKPEILLADEPTGNLDPGLSLEILRLFEAFHAVGVTVLIATHDLSLIAQMPYRLLTLQNGMIK